MNLDPRHKLEGSSAASGAGTWRVVTDSSEWDRLLAEAGGHPLQSAMWGDARRDADGIADVRVARRNADGTDALVRMELRRIPVLGGHVGWIPRGPVGLSEIDSAVLAQAAAAAGCNPLFIVTDLWRDAAVDVPADPSNSARPETIWVDLAPGRDALWKALDKRVRYSIERARKSNIEVERSRTPEDRAGFLALIEKISDLKQFDLPISRAVVERVMTADENAPVAGHLFVARSANALAGAALIIKCGCSIHYIAGGTDRDFAKERIGESLQWAIVDWAVAGGAQLYDMEGIDRVGNPGTYAFKKKLGGREVAFPGKQYYAMTAFGSAVAALDRFRNRSA
jgi:CelD/BcsL family acetyltransferase involved in cellulose biosynthesis